jgi:integrase
MAISNYFENNEQFWSVYVNIRSKVNPRIRLQKRLKGITSKTTALQEEKKCLRLLTEELAKQEQRGQLWSEMVDSWELSERNNPNRSTSETTFLDNLSLLRRWTNSIGSTHVLEIGRAEIKEILRTAEQQGKSRSFQVNLKAAISGVFKWAIDEGRIKGLVKLPTDEIKVQKKSEEKLPEILTLDEVKKLLFEAKNRAHPWFPIWATALLTGMRSGELHALLWSDIDFENNRILLTKSYNPRFRIVKSTKAKYWRNIPISSELRKLLLGLKSESTDRDQVLPRFWQWDKGQQAQILRNFCKEIGLKSIKFHTLRACFATQLLSSGISSIRVQKICGWKDLKTMERYVRLAGVDEKGATEILRILDSDSKAMDSASNLCQ